jgi:hypothetical protein
LTQRLLQIKQQPEQPLLSLKAMGAIGLHPTALHNRRHAHRTTEPQVERSGSGMHRRRCDALEMRRLTQQDLLLDDRQPAGSDQQQEQRLPHGSRGRSGRGIGLILSGTTTGLCRPSTFFTVMVPSISSH